MKKILVLLAHTDPTSYTATLADTYEAAARTAGHDVTRVNIGQVRFDPILHKGYKEIQPLEPDLLTLQQQFRDTEHLALFYPNWWNTMPAILKGLFDRFWLPGFAFNFDKQTHKLIQHLKGKTARVVVVAGTLSPFMTWWKYGDYTNEIRHGILEFAGFEVKVTALGPCERTTNVCREDWVKKIQGLGTRGV